MLNGRVHLKKGIKIIAEYCQLEKHILEADLIFTGEGCYDEQSSGGKVVSFVSELCKKHNKPCVICCGQKKVNYPPNDNCLLMDLRSYYELDECMTNTYHCLREMVSQNYETIEKHATQLLEHKLI